MRPRQFELLKFSYNYIFITTPAMLCSAIWHFMGNQAGVSFLCGGVMTYFKPALSIEQQIRHLRDHGMSIANNEERIKIDQAN